MPPRRIKRTRRRKPRQSNKPRTKVDKKLSRRISKLENNIETKYLDAVTDDGPTTIGYVKSTLTNMADGDDYNERIGNQVTAKRILLQYRLYQQPTDVPNQVRIMLLWDKQFNAGSPSLIFTGTSPLTEDISTAILDNRAGMVTTIAPYNMNTNQRFKILYDRLHNMTISGSDLTGTVHVVKRMINLHNAILKYSSSTEANENLPSRNILLVVYSSLGAQADLSLNVATRFFYQDT